MKFTLLYSALYLVSKLSSLGRSSFEGRSSQTKSIKFCITGTNECPFSFKILSIGFHVSEIFINQYKLIFSNWDQIKIKLVFFSPVNLFFFIKKLPIQKTLLSTWFTLKVKVGMNGNRHYLNFINFMSTR
jgi:hypothetical protein